MDRREVVVFGLTELQEARMLLERVQLYFFVVERTRLTKVSRVRLAYFSHSSGEYSTSKSMTISPADVSKRTDIFKINGKQNPSDFKSCRQLWWPAEDLRRLAAKVYS